ncbi:hypothetical protein, partial [Acinetobacter bereziniae]|uniref:hypothetical protein n=1 Tax=Acinetobacter bereziniae TaxID=106648 RepID=UPI001C65723E
IYCCTVSTAPLSAFLHSDWYTPEAPAFFSIFLPSFAFLHFLRGSCLVEGEFLFLPLFVLDEFICQQGGEILSFPGFPIKGE